MSKAKSYYDLSKDATQKGSYVGPEKLTFDFNSAPLTPQQVADVEKLVNERILENAGVSWIEVPYAEVKSRPPDPQPVPWSASRSPRREERQTSQRSTLSRQLPA